MTTICTAITDVDLLTFEVLIGDAWMPILREKARELLGIREDNEPRYLAILLAPYVAATPEHQPKAGGTK